jgi:hypothetical protein
MIRIVLGFIFILGTIECAVAQIRPGYIEISGSVVSHNNIPLEGATVLLTNSNKVKITEANGFFSTKVPKRDINIVISHVGFETLYETILLKDARITPEGLLEVTFRLTEKVNILLPVDVYGDKKSKKPDIVYNMPGNYVYDFNFLDDFLILLVKREGNKYLQKRYLYFDSLIYEKQIGVEFDNIFKDCVGNFHLLSKKYAVQFFPLTDKFIFYDRQPQMVFIKYVKNCVEYSNSNFVYLRRSAHNQATDYYSYLADSLIYRYFGRVFDELAFYYASDYLGTTKVSAFTFRDEGYGIVQAPGIARSLFTKMLLRPVFGPLMRVKNQFFVFDPIKDSIFHFDERSMPLGASSMRFHKQKHWSKWIETDVDHQKVYTRFDIRGQYYFSEINPHSGELINRYELYENYYPDHLKIKDGEAFYIKMVHNRRVLFRQPLGYSEQ